MRVGIDARLYGKEGRGLGRYISQLLLHLEKIDRENEYVVFLTRKGFAEYKPTGGNFTKVFCDIPWYGWREQIMLPRMIAREQCDIIHFPHFNVPVWYQGKFVVTIHDFILYDFPTLRATTRSALTFWLKYAAYRYLFGSAIARAQHIFTPSQYVKDRLLYHYPAIGDAKVTVTHEEGFAMVPIVTTMGTIAPSPYILAVGSAYPHKNLEAFVDAFCSLRQDLSQEVLPPKLLIVGRKDYFMRRLENCTSLRDVQFVGEVEDEELALLYRNAQLVCAVSCEEGFGLPGIEALQYGVPVIASDRSSLPEVYRDRAYYANPYDVEDMVRVLKTVFSVQRQGLLQEALPQQQIFSWRVLAQTTKAVYESA